MEENKLLELQEKIRKLIAEYMDRAFISNPKRMAELIVQLLKEEYAPPAPLELPDERITTNFNKALINILDGSSLQNEERRKIVGLIIEHFKGISLPLTEKRLQQEYEKIFVDAVEAVTKDRDYHVSNFQTQLRQKEEGLEEIKSDLAIFRELYKKLETKIKELESKAE